MSHDPEPIKLETVRSAVVPDPVADRHVRALDEARKPPLGCRFSAWMWRQQHRPDPIGQLAHVMARDPTWQGADTRDQAVAHMVRLNANATLQRLMGRAFDEFQGLRRADAQRARAKAKRAMRKAARRGNRPKR